MSGQLHAPAVFSRRKRERPALDKTPAELQRRTDSSCIYLLLMREKPLGARVLILFEILLAVSEVEYEDRRTDKGPSLFHYLINLMLKTVPTVYCYMNHKIWKWVGEEFSPLLLSDGAQVFLSVFSFLFSALGLVLIEMSHTEAAILGFMNTITYLRDTNKPFRKFIRNQTKWNDRKGKYAFMSSLRAH